MKLARMVVLGVCLPVALAAHQGGLVHADDLWTAWEFDPGVVILILLSSVLYHRGTRPATDARWWPNACFWTGLAVLVLALVSPLHPLGEVLFSAHMAQHEILMLLAAPLLVLSKPLVPFLRGLPPAWRGPVARWTRAGAFRRVWSALTDPLSAWWLHAAALWIWHIPRLFQATLRSEWIHTAQHLSFFLSALLFWWSLFESSGSVGHGQSVFYIFTTALHTGILGALLTFAPVVLYPAYASTARAWGLTPLEDQQVGGLIMWVPAGLVYLAAGLALFLTWIRRSGGVPDETYAE